MSALLTIEPEIFTAVPGLRVVVVQAAGIVLRDTATVERRWRAAWARVHTAFGFPNPQSHPHIQQWRAAMRAIGASHKEFPSSVEALVRRARRAPDPFHVHPLVDFYNAVSLEEVVPAGGYDLDAMPAPLVLRRTRAGDTFAALDAQAPEAVPPGEVAYTCGVTVVTRHLLWRQSRSTAIDGGTRRALFLSELLPAHADLAPRVGAALASGVRELFGATAASDVLSQDRPLFVPGALSP